MIRRKPPEGRLHLVMPHGKSLPTLHYIVVEKVQSSSTWVLTSGQYCSLFEIGEPKFDLVPPAVRSGLACRPSLAFVFRVTPSPVIMLGTEFRLAAYIRATRSRVPSVTPGIARLLIKCLWFATSFLSEACFSGCCSLQTGICRARPLKLSFGKTQRAGQLFGSNPRINGLNP